jgi:hypothetical protein
MQNVLPTEPLACKLKPMSDKKKQPEPAVKPGDRHKPRRMVGVPTPMANAIEEWATARYSDLTTEVRAALLEFIQSRGIKLPPPEATP